MPRSLDNVDWARLRLLSFCHAGFRFPLDVFARALLSAPSRCFKLKKPVSFSSACTTKRFPLSRCASAILALGKDTPQKHCKFRVAYHRAHAVTATPVSQPPAARRVCVRRYKRPGIEPKKTGPGNRAPLSLVASSDINSVSCGPEQAASDAASDLCC
jgi:hypothetical protein